MIVGRFLSRTLDATAALSAACIAFIALSICCEVIARYFFHRPLRWTVEISEYLQIYLAFLSAAWVLRKKGHVTLDIAVDRFGPGGKRVFRIVTDILGIIVAAALSLFAAIVAAEQFLLGTPVIKSLEVPKWIVIAPISIGMFLVAIEFFVKLVDDIRGGG
ncbi:MAG: TRAP transporter small permease [Syntrophorhabdaceae bacterium]|nr:TRAP transporter small permease [Syntrophorhabdaceae bacterium]